MADESLQARETGRDEVQAVLTTSNAAEGNLDGRVSPVTEERPCQRRGCDRTVRGKRGHGEFCGPACRQWIHRHPEDDLRRSRLVLTRRGRREVPGQLKPSALRILGRLQHGPATNKELMDLAGFRYSARVLELREAGHVIRVDAPGPTPGVRVYTLEAEVVHG